MQLNEILQKLKETEPSLFDKNGELILEKFKAYLNNEKTPLSKESYTLNWLGKSYAKALVHDKNRTFLAPNEEHNAIKENKKSKNLLIQGDNLAVLKHLRKAYRNSVKMIYIDPPYNTGSDGFVYNDDRKYSATQIAEITGEDEEVAERIFNFINRNASSHSAWLTFMYPRLKVARELLKDDGVIFISIDDNEQAQLKMLCDEVFGEENFVGELPTIMNLKGNQDEFGFAGTHEYTCVYSKSKENTVINQFNDEENLDEWKEDEISFYKKGANLKATGTNAPREQRPNLYFPIFIDSKNHLFITEDNKPPVNSKEKLITIYPITNGKEMSWRWSKNKFIGNPKDTIIIRNGNDISLYKKQRPSLGDLPSKKPKTVFYKPEYSSGNGTNQVKSLFNKKVFKNPKPIDLIIDFIQLGTNKNDIILDFFAGSGTMAHATMLFNLKENKNLKFISVQLDEKLEPKTEEQRNAMKLGYTTVFDITKARIEKASAKIKAENPNYKGDLAFKEFKLENYPNGYGVSPENAQQGAEQGELFSQFDFDKEKLNTILTTWTVNDGLPLTEPPQEIKLKDYVAYIAENHLYLLHENFNSHHLSDLLAKLDDMKNGLNIEKIIAFGHHFDSKTLREIEEAVHQYKTRKGVQLYWETRYE